MVTAFAILVIATLSIWTAWATSQVLDIAATYFLTPKVRQPHPRKLTAEERLAAQRAEVAAVEARK
jgi:hypothetical protein